MNIRLLFVTFSMIVHTSCSLVCTEGNIQLDNTTSPPLVMICAQGQWGYVCARELANSPWTLANIGVACQQLGYTREDIVEVPRLVNQISEVLPVHYLFLYCTGVERRLIDCAHGPSSSHSACRRNSRYRYGTASCSTTMRVECNIAGEIKIVNDTIQICSQGEWYTVCGDTNIWKESQAMVACRQLGLNPNGSSAVKMTTSSGDTQLLNVVFHCIGSEQSLLECSSSTTDYCTSKAAITCGTERKYLFSSLAILASLTSQDYLATVPENTQSSLFMAASRLLSNTPSNVSSTASSSKFIQHVAWVVGLVVGIITGATVVLSIWILHNLKRKRVKSEGTIRLEHPVSDEQRFTMSSNAAYGETLRTGTIEDNLYEIATIEDNN